MRSSSSGLIANDKSARMALYLVCGAIVSISVQYIFVQFDLLVSGKISLWALKGEALEGTGIMRYVKDLYLLAFAIFWPGLILVYRKRSNGLLFKALYIEAVILFLGLIGHVIDPNINLIFAGIRWMVLLHAGIGVFMLIKSFGILTSKESILFHRFMFAFLIVICGWGIIQSLVLGPSTITVIRLSSIFANSGVYAFAAVGAGLLFVVLPDVGRNVRLTAISLALISTVLSGTRSAMLLAALFLLLAFIAPKRGVVIKQGKSVVIAALAIVFLALVFVALPLIESSAGRGGIIETQINGPGRITNLVNLSEKISNSPGVNIFFGKGLGYGTNNAFNLFPELIGSDPWFTLIDNTYATWFLQFGLLGLVVLLILMGQVLLSLWKAAGKDTASQYGFFAIAISLFVVTVAGNFFESYHFLLFTFISAAVLFQSSNSPVNLEAQAERNR